MEELRDMGKGKLKKYFQSIFTKFDTGRSIFSWNWFAAIFQLIWYMFKGMWPKVFLYGIILWAILKISGALELFSSNVFLWVIAFIYFGAMANYDYYLYKRKNEFFWPKIQYKKLKIPFWLITASIILYSGIAALISGTMEPEALGSYASDRIKFGNAPAQWIVYKDPPHLFSLSTPDVEGDDTTGLLTYTAFRGTKFMGYIVEEQEKGKVYKGLIALIENKPIFFKKYNSVRDDAVINKAKMLAGEGKMPSWLNRWMSAKALDIEYLNFAGQEWGCTRNTMELNYGGKKTTLYMTTYWTVADGKAIYVISESFEPYKDEIKTQVESFLNPFGPVTVTGLAEEETAPATVSESSDSDSGPQEEGADTVEDRKLPQLEQGKWEPLFEIGQNIYPSVVISTATLKEGLWDDEQHIGDPWGTIGISVRGTKENCPINVEIYGESFVKPSTFTGTLAEKDTVYCVYPDLKYDYEKLLAVKQTVPEILTFKVKIGEKAEPEKIVRVQVRPVNECVIYFVDSSGNLNDVSFFFAAYVNENHPIINQIMKEAIASKKIDSFSGYSGDTESVMNEIEAIWGTLKKRNMHYSTIPASADDDNPYIETQYVRLLGESINYTQANCVDGSVLMASIFRKIGLDVSLVEIPGHMFITVDLDEEGEVPIFIETTMLSQDTLSEAMEEGYEEYTENQKKFDSEKDEDQEYNTINIQSARVMGIMPIKDSSAN